MTPIDAHTHHPKSVILVSNVDKLTVLARLSASPYGLAESERTQNDLLVTLIKPCYAVETHDPSTAAVALRH
jgi:hypothetical protein